MSTRTDKVGDLLRGEIATILRRDVKDPRVGMAAVTSVRVSGDLRYATVRISVLGEDQAREGTVEALERARGFIRSLLARRVHLRTVPELAFELDRGPEHSQRIFELLEKLDDDGSQDT